MFCGLCRIRLLLGWMKLLVLWCFGSIKEKIRRGDEDRTKEKYERKVGGGAGSEGIGGRRLKKDPKTCSRC